MRLSPKHALLSCLFLAAAPDRVSAQYSSFELGSFERILGLGGQATAFAYRRIGFGLTVMTRSRPASGR